MKTTLPFRALAAVALSALISVAACAGSVQTAEQTQRDLLARLPSGATAIGLVDVTDVQDAIPAERWTEYEKMLESDEDWRGVERFTAVTGIDPRTDIKQIAFAAVPTDGDEVEAVVLISASFDRERIESLLTSAPTQEYEGHTIYALDRSVWAQFDDAGGEQPETGGEENPGEPDRAERNRPGNLVLLDGETVLLGDEDGVRLGIDTEVGNRETLGMDPYINDLVADVNGEGQMWFVATREAWAEGLAQIPEGTPVPASALEGIETITMSMRFGDGLATRLAGIARTAEDAGLLADSLNGYLAMGKMMLQSEQPEIYEILDRAIRVAADDRTISIAASLTDADLDTLRALAEEQATPR